jgi:hypothetical protein
VSLELDLIRVAVRIIVVWLWASTSLAQAAQLWLAPLQPHDRPDGTPAGSADYFDLFHSAADNLKASKEKSRPVNSPSLFLP